MKKSIAYTVLFSIVFLSLIKDSYAWENKLTHPAITTQAVSNNEAKVDDYLKTQLSLSSGLSTQLYWDFPSDIETRMTKNGIVDPAKTKTILDWLRAGSSIEDEDGKWKPWRPRHHFYDPTRNSGLDNQLAHPDWTAPLWSNWLPLGESALSWAIDGSASYEPYTNNDKWSNARNLFYSALTAQTQSDRQSYLAESLMKLGCVLHLLEDMGVPAHTRNDFLFAHYRTWADYGDALENDVETKIAANGGNSLWSGSGAVAFDKLTKYFDTDTRTPPYYYLGDGVLPPATWGLAEATNYQFFSLSTIFDSNLLLYYFPHPDKYRMGTPITEGTVDKKIYFNGVNYGVSHIARKSYTYYYTETYNIYGMLPIEVQQRIDSTITTDDQKVFEDYANITIPRTINYVTGLANYFFRGRLSATAKCVECNVIELTITNQSVNSGIQQTLKGGSFEIYWDNGTGDRTQITDFVIDGGWGAGSTLAYNASIKATFIKPAGASPVKYVIVYNGNICENPADTDSDDENAIATTAVTAPSDNCCAPLGACCDFCSGNCSQTTQENCTHWWLGEGSSCNSCKKVNCTACSACGSSFVPSTLSATVEADEETWWCGGYYRKVTNCLIYYDHFSLVSCSNGIAYYKLMVGFDCFYGGNGGYVDVQLSISSSGSSISSCSGLDCPDKTLPPCAFSGSATWDGSLPCVNNNHHLTISWSI